MTHKVLLTERLIDPLHDSFLNHPSFDIEFKLGPFTEDQLLHYLKDKEGLVCPLNQRISRIIFEKNPQLKVIATLSVGTNHIDLEAAREFNVRIAHTPGVLTEATADLTWALLLNLARRIREGEELVRTGQWGGWQLSQLLGIELSGKTLGIIGLGAIGQAVARRAFGFEMHVIYTSRTPKKDFEASHPIQYTSLETLLKQADIICIHAALTPETYHLLNRERLAWVKSSALIINVARGPLIDEEALIDFLDDRRIAGAALDVYEQEPLVPLRLKESPYVVLAPHLGSATHETRLKMCQMAVSALEECFLNQIGNAVFCV